MTASAVVDQINLGDHVCWAYDDDADGLDAAGRFVASGLRLGHKVICFVDAESPWTARIHLDNSDVPTESALASGQLRILPAVESYLADDRFAPQAMIDVLAAESARAQRENYPGLRLVGGMGWALRGGTTLEQLRRYEADANRLFLGGRVAALCLYDRRLFSTEQLRAVAGAHPATVGPHANRTWTPMLRAHRTVEPPGLRLVGQVDRSNRDAFAAMLTDVTTPTRHRPAVLDVSELTFADVGAASALARASRTGQAGVRLVGCRPALARLLELVRETGARCAVGHPA